MKTAPHMNGTQHINDSFRSRRLGWPDLGIAAVAAVVFYAIGIAAIIQVPAEQSAMVGLVEYAVSGLAPMCAVAAVLLIRRHGPAAVGLRRAPFRWVAIGAGLGLGVVVLNIGSVMLMDAMNGGEFESVQGGYQSAAGSGFLSFAVALVLGAILTPLGEEMLFRGVLANALNRYGPWVAVLVSSSVFALAHGINYLLLVSFVVGVIAALLLRRTGSIWPGVALHAVNNSASVLLPAVYALAS